MSRRDLEDVLRDHTATISFESKYERDDFKFNPYGIVSIGQS